MQGGAGLCQSDPIQRCDCKSRANEAAEIVRICVSSANRV
jgi:hypothetical protein